ncbi:MAG TPA: Trm112 family protein [bacterium]|nr:Trm112 family protein [bacterium]HQO35556.1 Trm112 family protein [bacterium]
MTKRDLLEKITACPICQGELEWRSEEILCKACNKVYPIRSGIPYFILD